MKRAVPLSNNMIMARFGCVLCLLSVSSVAGLLLQPKTQQRDRTRRQTPANDDSSAIASTSWRLYSSQPRREGLYSSRPRREEDIISSVSNTQSNNSNNNSINNKKKKAKRSKPILGSSYPEWIEQGNRVPTMMADNLYLSSVDKIDETRNSDEGENCNNGNNPSSYSRLLQVEIDLEREKTRLESFESYVLVSILTASASFSFMGEFDLPIQEDPICAFTTLVAGLSALCGLHATIVFSLCSLYGKTALGLKRDDVYEIFLSRVGAQRFRGFKAFSASLLLFALECALLLYTKVPGEMQPVAAILGMAILYPIVTDWSTIVKEAMVIFNAGDYEEGGASEEDEEEEVTGTAQRQQEQESPILKNTSNDKSKKKDPEDCGCDCDSLTDIMLKCDENEFLAPPPIPVNINNSTINNKFRWPVE